MMPRVLVLFLFLVLGCATTHDPGSQPENSAKDESATASEESTDKVCVRNATVTVRVENQSSMDLQITFGSYRAARPAEGFSLTTYSVPRVHLQSYVRIQILRGGLQVGVAPLIQTEAVFCNIATLVIGSRPRYSIFYGDEILAPSRKGGDEEEEGEEAPPDSTSSETGD